MIFTDCVFISPPCFSLCAGDLESEPACGREGGSQMGSSFSQGSSLLSEEVREAFQQSWQVETWWDLMGITWESRNVIISSRFLCCSLFADNMNASISLKLKQFEIICNHFGYVLYWFMLSIFTSVDDRISLVTYNRSTRREQIHDEQWNHTQSECSCNLKTIANNCKHIVAPQQLKSASTSL